MISNFHLTYKHNHVLLILSLVLLWLNYTTTIKGAVVMNNKCINKERSALLDIKALLQSPNNYFISRWGIDEEDDCCQWIGVSCSNQTSRVTKLKLNSWGLEGEISTSLLKLTYLTHLNLSYNRLNGTIPLFIGAMTKLRYLDLSYNSYNGTIPMFIGSFIELRYLSLSGNNLYGTIPREFGNLTKLEHLSLGNMASCRVENLDWLSNLTHLRYLKMDDIFLAKENYWVNIITSLRNLTFLSLERCNLSQVVYPYSSSPVNFSLISSSIVDLYLGENNLNSSFSHWLFPLTGSRLEQLHLDGNKLDGIPEYLGNLCSLKTLNLNRNSIFVELSDFLKSMSGCTAATLQYLDASSNQLKGSLSYDIQIFSSLTYLSLAHNRLNETLSEKVWELPNLENLDVSFNFLRGAISESIVRSKIRNINLSNNLLQGVTVTSEPRKSRSNISSVEVIDLSSCKLGPHFPRWIHTLKNLTYLDISSNGISDSIPEEFWSIWPSQLRYLNLSSNNFSGKVPDLSSNFYSLALIDLSSNNFYGPIPSFISSSLFSLDLSKNKFYGEISFLCHQLRDGLFKYLDLSHNLLTGQIPDCLWHFKYLEVLNLGDNKFYGRLPASIEYLISLKVLYLNNNNFSGELSLSLRNCTMLSYLDLGSNKFFGNVPVWIGENLSGLYALSLSSNNFFGPIPVQLCQLVNLQILDLSMNNLNETIPSCVNNLTSMVQEVSLTPQNVYVYAIPYNLGKVGDYWKITNYVGHAMIQWQGNKREFSSNLGLLKSIDLSSNKLKGKIPGELTDLHGLLTLNLSKNALVGEIPHKISQMRNLLVLDLSRNNLSGGLPSNMSSMNFLNYIDVSYNNLSGRIPSGTQFQTSEPSRYTRNAGLCGPPLKIACLGDKVLQVSPPIGESDGDDEEIDVLQRWFYIGGTTGFVISFWIVCSVLLVNRRGRHTFFRFSDNLEIWVCVKMRCILQTILG